MTSAIKIAVIFCDYIQNEKLIDGATARNLLTPERRFEE